MRKIPIVANLSFRMSQCYAVKELAEGRSAMSDEMVSQSRVFAERLVSEEDEKTVQMKNVLSQ